MLTFYIMQDDDLSGSVKVGKDTGWPDRYKQARCHTPGRISVPALFHLPDMDRKGQEYLDGRVKLALQTFARNVSYGSAKVQEWYDISPEAAVRRIMEIPEFVGAQLKRNEVPVLPQSQLMYEEWRDRGKSECRWRAFLFEAVEHPNGSNHPHVGRLKLAAGSLYDTAYRYNFTYCPFPVLLVGGFETNLPISENNTKIMTGWENVVAKLGNGSNAQPMGWLQKGTTHQEVRDALAVFECTAVPLARPKPHDARPKDPSLSATAIGARYPGDRIVDFYMRCEI